MLLTVVIWFIAGIANHEEYSLVRDLPESEREKTLTLKRDKSIAKDQKKMDEMKKRLHTDDECMFCFVCQAAVALGLFLAAVSTKASFKTGSRRETCIHCCS